MDYRKFLARTERLVLPYFGGTRVEAPSRRLRVASAGNEREPGWWQFEVEGRRARFVDRADPPDLSRLPAIRGHWAAGWLFTSGREMERIALAPDIEPEPLAPCSARRWYGGELLFDTAEFEDEPELRAREALEEGRGIADVKGVTPSLRAAYGYALMVATGRGAGVSASPREVAARVHDIAEGGREVARVLLQQIADQRRRHTEQQRGQQLADQARQLSAEPVRANPIERADAALDAAGARMLRCRRLSDRQLEVAFAFMGERFISVVDSRTLQVRDAGICLSGADRELTLDSLPSAIREAIETHQLYMTRH